MHTRWRALAPRSSNLPMNSMTEQASWISHNGYVRPDVGKDRRTHSNTGTRTDRDLLENGCVGADIAPLLNAYATQQHCV